MSYFIITNEKPTNSSIEALKIKHESEILYLFTTSDERFNNKNYEPIDENGDLQNRGTIVLNNIPIAEDAKSAYEQSDNQYNTLIISKSQMLIINHIRSVIHQKD